MNEIESDFLSITPEETSERLDKILANRFSGIRSRSYFQMLIEEGRVLVNGLPIKKRYIPSAGDEVEIHFLLTPEIKVNPEPISLDILFEDEHLIAVNKPAGMVVHPAVGNWTGTFVNALLHHCQQLSSLDSGVRPGIVHRLDKDTSGLLVAAKTSAAHQGLVEKFAQKQIKKEYLAVCIGNPGDVQLDFPIGRHPVDRKRMAVNYDHGKPALTFCRSTAWDGKFSLVNVLLATGRTHQIRVHLKHHGTPILGDAAYGNLSLNAKYGVLRQLLHAHTLEFTHPITQQALQLIAPLPNDILQWIRLLRRES